MTQSSVQAYAAFEAKGALEPFEYKLPALGPEQVTIKVTHCGLCHSDLSMLHNEWGITEYPFVPGHEIVGTVVETGEFVKGLKVGDNVGLGWFSESCMYCDQCMSGNHSLCARKEQTIVGRFGGFGNYVRCHWAWAIPLPSDLDASKVGPLFCAGGTVFKAIVQAQVNPLQRVGVIGIGGLGHLALQFLNKWGCEVTAFTSSPSKAEQAKLLGAHHTISSTDDESMRKIAGSLDFILNTTSVDLNWEAYLNALAPQGRLHTVGVNPTPISVSAFTLLEQKSVSGNDLGSPALTKKMLDFCVRHQILPVTEEFALSNVNDALAHLEAGKARYRIVLKV